ncbi:hypothetical protein T552_03311 [Pneumocystis carinii B80]|uniref:Uncharacterized protein n=1 Tax=Pneumocystis carinii (strain B80) TaxID=1408658 RepID=A0A0W4ZBI1_PNEC8|nr:hypothetical protein T552_03311 [Pneumocystis carinii B80]KTW25699.1 hypothetical protein T552_03311 [Pneumocystis carinii B80]
MTSFKNISTFRSKFLSENQDCLNFPNQESNISRFHKPQTEKQINNFLKDHRRNLKEKPLNHEKLSEEELIIRLTTSKSPHSSIYSLSPPFIRELSNDLERLERACGSSTSSKIQEKTNQFFPLSYSLYNKSQSSENSNATTIQSSIHNYEDLGNSKKDISIKSPNSSEYFMKLSTNVSPIYPLSGHMESYIPLPDLMSDSRASTSCSEESEIKPIHSTPLYKVTRHTKKTAEKKKDTSYKILKEMALYDQDFKHNVSDTQLNVESKNILNKKSNSIIETDNFHENDIHNDITSFSEDKRSCNITDPTIDKTIKLLGPGAWTTTPQTRTYTETLSNFHISGEKSKHSHISKTQNEDHQLTKMLLLLQEELKSTIVNVEELELRIQKFEQDFKDKVSISKDDLSKLQFLYEVKKREIKTYISLCIKYFFFILCIMFLAINILNWALPMHKTYSELPLYQSWPT